MSTLNFPPAKVANIACLATSPLLDDMTILLTADIYERVVQKCPDFPLLFRVKLIPGVALVIVSPRMREVINRYGGVLAEIGAN